MWQQTAKQMLEGQILPFWQNLRDEEHGGYYGNVDFDLRVDKKADKGCILHSRILWFFSTAVQTLGRQDLLPFARHAYEFLTGPCMDSENGGVFWSVSYDGKPADDTKHTYNQAFAIYALSAYYAASGDEDALQAAKQLYGLIETKCHGETGYGEAYDRAFVPASNEKLSENGVMAHHTMNTLLHVLEGYTGLYAASPSADVAASLRSILSAFQTGLYNPEKQRLEVFFDEDMHSLLNMHSFGHDIEASWLIDRACEVLGDDALAAEIDGMTTALARQVYKEALHDGCLWNEQVDEDINKQRIWWVQGEGVVGFLQCWQKTGEAKYLEAASTLLEFIQTHVVDKRPGSEWFYELNEDNTPVSSQPMAGEWKCPYHNGRMCFEILRRNPDAASRI